MARNPIHPGEILTDELADLNLSAAELARQIEVPPNRISQILAGKRTISADTADFFVRPPPRLAFLQLEAEEMHELGAPRLDRREANAAYRNVGQINPDQPLPIVGRFGDGLPLQ